MYKYSVSILGTGFIGLCSAACFAEKDIKVIASTHNEKKASIINEYKTPFFEEGLEEMLERVKNQKPELLKCSTDPIQAIIDTDISMITQVSMTQANGLLELQVLLMHHMSLGPEWMIYLLAA